MDNTEASFRELMVALLALGPASGPDQAAMRTAIARMLQAAPDAERLAKAWRQVRRVLEELHEPPPVAAAAVSPEEWEENVKAAWEQFSCGVHIDPEAGPFADGVDGIVTLLALLDRKGDVDARKALDAVVLAPQKTAAAGWVAVERAALSSTGKNKWRDRAKALRDLEPAPLQPLDRSWLGLVTEGRRRLHLGEALGRSFGVAFEDIQAELNAASSIFGELADVYGIGAVELVRGRAFAWRGQLTEAGEALTAALLAFVQLNNPFRLADTAYELGGAYRELHRFEAARRVQARSVALEAKRGVVGPLARAMQSYALTHVNEARLSAKATIEEQALRDRLLDRARLLAGRAFAMTATQPAAAPEDIPQSDANVVPDLPAALVPSAPDNFRAAISARDLAEIALLRGDEVLARKWLDRALLESGSATPPGQTMMDAFVMPAMTAVGKVLPEAARQKWDESAEFELVRLAELDQRLTSLTQISPARRAEDLDLVARAWDLNKLPSYAIEAWLNAADVAESAKSTGDDAPLDAAAARHWRFLALRQAECVGSAVHARGVINSPVDLSDVEKAAAAAAKVSVMQLIASRGEARLFYVRAFDSIGASRLLIRSPVIANWNRQPVEGEGGMLRERLETISRQRPGVPRILRSGDVAEALWLLDEGVDGPTLETVMQEKFQVQRVLIMLAELGDVLQALLSSGMTEVWPDPAEIILAPGDKLVLRRYGSLFLGSQPPASVRIGQNVDVDAFIHLSSRWIRSSAGFGSGHRDLLTNIARYARSAPPEPREALRHVASKLKQAGLSD